MMYKIMLEFVDIDVLPGRLKPATHFARSLQQKLIVLLARTDIYHHSFVYGTRTWNFQTQEVVAASDLTALITAVRGKYVYLLRPFKQFI
jgi:hypothetical protein